MEFVTPVQPPSRSPSLTILDCFLRRPKFAVTSRHIWRHSVSYSTMSLRRTLVTCFERREDHLQFITVMVYESVYITDCHYAFSSASPIHKSSVHWQVISNRCVRISDIGCRLWFMWSAPMKPKDRFPVVSCDKVSKVVDFVWNFNATPHSFQYIQRKWRSSTTLQYFN